MKLLLDTHVLIWAAISPEKLSAEARGLIEDFSNTLYFSAASLWETAINFGLNRPDFTLEPTLFAAALTENGFTELPISARHAIRVPHLPPIYKDPFDRLLIAQALTDGILLLTGDDLGAQYPGPIRRV